MERKKDGFRRSRGILHHKDQESQLITTMEGDQHRDIIY